MIKNRVRTTTVALAAMLCMAVGITGVATAGAESSAKLTIHYNGDGFEGKIKSSKAKCLANREVTVHKGNGQELYSDTTDSNGEWNTGNSGQAHGKFYATVDAKGNCIPLVSKTLKL